MAGYVLKITMEQSSPPMWRRLLIPDRITFYDLHWIIQTAFGWENDHLHDFSIPTQKINIIPTEVDGHGAYNFEEETTVVDEFLMSNKWIRYTYDFGDNWSHKIVMEKINESYTERYAQVLKFKGDNFLEDSGGVYGFAYAAEDAPEEEWEEGLFYPSMITPYDIQQTNVQLQNDLIPITECEQNYMEHILKVNAAFEQIKKWKYDDLKTVFANTVPTNKATVRKKSVERGLWSRAKELSLYTEYEFLKKDIGQEEIFPYSRHLYVGMGEHTIRDGLDKLNQDEAKTYCQYWQLSIHELSTKEEMVEKIYESMKKNPEYLLFIFNKHEMDFLLACYQEIKKGNKINNQEIFDNKICIQKAIALGIIAFDSFNIEAEIVTHLNFAKDTNSMLTGYSSSLKKKYYARIPKISQLLEYILQIYGIIELDKLYEMYFQYATSRLSEQEFRIFIYLHGRFNDLYDIYIDQEEENYVCQKGLNPQKILEQRSIHMNNLPYKIYDEEQLKTYGDIKYDFEIEFLHDCFKYQLNLDEEKANSIVSEVYLNIKNGEKIDTIFSILQQSIPQWSHSIGIELWEIVLGLFKESTLPMLKGASRNSSARIEQLNWWDYELLSNYTEDYQNKDKPLYEFPSHIQGQLYEMSQFYGSEYLSALSEFMVKNQVQSEEFLYMLGVAKFGNVRHENIFSSLQTGEMSRLKGEHVEEIIEKLRKSSIEGEVLAKKLEERIIEYQEIDDFCEEDIEIDEMMWKKMAKMQNPVEFSGYMQPYVSQEKKIGRNDLCPCGSGKKYKKCCGK
ncbi:MAG: plasmid pRiA4b ORF-3 family protein [Eubacteriales bacterium]